MQVPANKIKKPVLPVQIILDYSDKSFAVIGDTKPLRKELYLLGGKYNPNLKCGPGWIFNNSRLATVKSALSL